MWFESVLFCGQGHALLILKLPEACCSTSWSSCGCCMCTSRRCNLRKLCFFNFWGAVAARGKLQGDSQQGTWNLQLQTVQNLPCLASLQPHVRRVSQLQSCNDLLLITWYASNAQCFQCSASMLISIQVLRELSVCACPPGVESEDTLAEGSGQVLPGVCANLPASGWSQSPLRSNIPSTKRLPGWNKRCEIAVNAASRWLVETGQTAS